MKKNRRLGLSVEGDRLTLVESDGAKTPATVIQTATLVLKTPAENAHALRHLLKKNKINVRSVTVCLPHRLAAVKTVRVPSVDPAEIRSMALLQACRLLPFSPEDIVAGHESVEMSSGGFTNILLTVMRREDVDPVVTLCRAAGLNVDRILLDSQARTALVAEQVNSPCLFVLAEDREGMVAMIDKRKPRFVRTFPWDGSAECLARETALSVEAYQKESPFWNPTQILWCGPDPAGTIRKSLGIALRSSVDVYEMPATLNSPLARNAYAAANAPRGGTNLVPENEQKRQAREKKTRQKKVFGFLTLSLVLAWVAVGWGKLRRLESQIAALDQEKKFLSQQAEGLEAKADRLEEARRSEGGGVMGVLRTLKAALPTGVSLNGFSYERRGSVVLRGETETLAEVLATVSALEKTALFKKVELRNSGAVTIHGKEMAQFQIVCDPVGDGQ
jgi:cell division protein FtsB